MKVASGMLTLFTWMAAHTAFGNICEKVSTTGELKSHPNYQHLLTVDPLEEMGKLTWQEGLMILASVEASDSSDAKLDVSEAWGEFVDAPYFNNNGDIDYFEIDSKRFALVTYYPGDNEYGAILELSPNTDSLFPSNDIRDSYFKMHATVGDGEIDCLSWLESDFGTRSLNFE